MLRKQPVSEDWYIIFHPNPLGTKQSPLITSASLNVTVNVLLWINEGLLLIKRDLCTHLDGRLTAILDSLILCMLLSVTFQTSFSTSTTSLSTICRGYLFQSLQKPTTNTFLGTRANLKVEWNFILLSCRFLTSFNSLIHDMICPELTIIGLNMMSFPHLGRMGCGCFLIS